MIFFPRVGHVCDIIHKKTSTSIYAVTPIRVFGDAETVPVRGKAFCTTEGCCMDMDNTGRAAGGPRCGF